MSSPVGWRRHSDPFIKVAIIAGFLAWARRCRRPLVGGTRARRANVGPGFRMGAAALLVVAVVILILVVIPGSRGYFENNRVAADSTAVRVLEPLLVIPLGTVVFEEILFRGVLLGVLLRCRTPPPSRHRLVGGVRPVAPAAGAARRHREQRDRRPWE